MDKFEKIASSSDFCVAFLGNIQARDYEIVDLSTALKADEETIRQRQERGLCFLGVAGLVQGVPDAALTDAYGRDVQDALAEAYARHVEAAFRESLEILSLTRLHGLPDTRTLN